MDTKAAEVITGLSLIEESLKEQRRDGLSVVNGNTGCGNNNLWGYLYMIVPNDKELAEHVRRSFLGKSPHEALTLIENIHREYFHEALHAGLL